MRPLFVTVMLAFVLGGCAKAPPDLTPEAARAFHASQAVKVLDAFRDAAIAANAQVPPLLATDAARKVVLYHQSVVKVLQAAPAGWAPFARAGLDDLTSGLSAKDRALLGPYAALVKATLAEVVR